MQLKDIGEFGLIRRLAKTAIQHDPSLHKGIGDDAAVIALGSKKCLLVTTDTLRENIHFTLDTTPPFLLGKKALAVNLSDIAAMGGMPRYYVVSLSVPGTTPFAFVKDLYRGMCSRARLWNVLLVGGDTTGSNCGISITITVIGTAARNHVVYRRGARPGDRIYVTGTVGDAALGLALLKQGVEPQQARQLVLRHRDPDPRIAAGLMLAHKRIPTSMIDVSDGILADLRHILEQSGTGARIRSDAIPLSRQYLRWVRQLGGDPYRYALCGGEDYELLFTAPPQRHAAIERIAYSLGLTITPIGEITARRGQLEVLDRTGKPMHLGRQEGFVHF
ncbi:MAG: thiamine-phosphate kinase [Desulfobacterota bacterium]|nr:thiamine-phosphate kinase [Thermodesulfobacteriota bacterium]